MSNFDKCNDVFELASFSMKSRSVRQQHRTWLLEIEGKFGLICLSHSWRKALMWAHYGSSGTGACLVFSVPKKDFTKVEYIPDRLSHEDDFYFPRPSDGQDFFDFCSKKFSAWRYESEARLFCNLENNANIVDVTINKVTMKFLNFTEDFKPIGVINGPKPQHGKSDFESEIREQNLEFFQCRPAFTKFHMTSQREERCWK
ncbi:DUF2971 domain-containing protein [Pseudosulfitobacter sp. SM2401]|uniref:DUF2971 domain-containing protein n=1 Tax=Pseudosulfitobacter sp. SM2401 TaxID=3350098 RepID=UPI0036F43767